MLKKVFRQYCHQKKIRRQTSQTASATCSPTSKKDPNCEVCGTRRSRERQTKEARNKERKCLEDINDSWPLVGPTLIVLLSRLAVAHFVDVDGINLDVRVKSVFVEQDSTTGEMGNIEMVREALVMKVFDCFLQRNDAPFACKVLFNRPWLPMSRKTQEPCDVPAFEHGCQKDCGAEGKFGGAGGESLDVCHPSSVGLNATWRRSRNPRASEHKRVRTDFHCRHQNPCESNKRTFLCHVNRGHAKTKYWGLSSDIHIPVLGHRRYGPLAPSPPHRGAH